MTKPLRSPPRVQGSGERRRRWTAPTLATLLLTLTNLPGVIVAAAPQVFARVGPGASGLPLQVTAFSDPSFGELSDAVNVATGNAYVDLGQVNRNNSNTTATANTGTTLGGAASPGTSLSGSFNVNGVLRLNGFNPNNPNIPQEWALGVGDGGYQYYRRASDDEINNAPTWINERYANVRGSTTYFISKPQAGVQVEETWIVQYRLGNGQYAAFYYDHDGNRTAFWRDGEYADYAQTPHEQYRGAAYAGDAEGSNSPKTEFTYTGPGNGHLARVRDSWGRSTTYEWDEGAGVVVAINLLLQNENDNGSWRRRVEYVYEIVGNQRVVSYMVFRTYDARNQKIGRWFDLNYRTGTNGEVLLYQLIRPVLADGSEAQQMGPSGGKTTTYTYDAQNRVTRTSTPGEPDTTFGYQAGGDAGGTLVTQLQGANEDAYHRETYWHFTPEGWLRRKVVRDWSPTTTETRFLTTDYWYNPNGTGQVVALNLPSGMQYQYSYDRHGNRTRETVYLSQRRWQDGVDGDQLRTTRYEYDRDNQVTKEVLEGRSGQGRSYDQLSETTYGYGNNERQVTYRDFDASYVGGQQFTANREVEEARVIDGSLRRKFFTGIDVYGRAANTRLHYGGEADAYRTVNYGFWDGSTTLNNRVQIPDGNGEWVDNRMVRSYGDLVQSKTVNGRNTSQQLNYYHYDEFGNVVLQQDINDYVGRWDGATPVLRTRETFDAFDGFGNKVWHRVLSQASGQDYQWYEQNKVWTYYATGELKAVSDGHPGLGVRTLTDYTYDTNGGSYNFGRLLRVRTGEGSGTAVSTSHQITEYGYDGYGLVRATKVDGFTTTVDYDSLGRAVKTTNPDGSYKWVRFREDGSVHREVAKNVGSGEVSTWHDVDSAGREYFTLYPDGGSVRTFYDAFDRPIKITDNRLGMNGSEADRSTYLVYDTAGNLIKKLDPALVTAAGQVYADGRRPYAEYGYDLLDRVVYAPRLLFGATVSPTNMVWPANSNGMATRTEYDAEDRPTKVTDNEGYTTTFTYATDDQPTSVTRQVWKTGEVEYGTVQGGFTSVTTRTAYNALGQPVQQMDARGNSKRTTYNVQGQPTSQVDERNFVTKVFGYTGDGLLQSVWEPDNNPGTGIQPGNVNLGNPSASHLRTEYREYDNRVFPARVYTAHMNAQAGPGSGALTSYQYDHQGKPTRTTLPPDQNGATATIEQSYDNLGNTLTTRDALGFPTVFTYDWAGRLTNKHEQARPGNQTDFNAGLQNGLRSEYRYDTAGNLTYKEERGLITEYRYNSLGRVIYESRPRAGAGTGTNWKLRTYRLDGLMTAETSYDYTGNLVTRPDVTQFGSDPPTVTRGNLTITEYNGRGDVWARQSRGANNNLSYTNLPPVIEYSMWQYVDGLGNRYKRVFQGNKDIYAEQRIANGMKLGHASVLSYWKFDQNANLIDKWDTPAASGDSWSPRDASDRQNVFSYSYTPTNKEATSGRNIAVRVWGSGDSRYYELTRQGGNSGILITGSLASSAAIYNERDQLLQYLGREKSPMPSPGANGCSTQGCGGQLLPNRHYDFGAYIERTTNYAYYPSGQRYNADVVGVGSRRVDGYDQRGREINVYDSNGTGKGAGQIRSGSYLSQNVTTTILTNYNASGQQRMDYVQGGQSKYYELQGLTVGGLTGFSEVQVGANSSRAISTYSASSGLLSQRGQTTYSYDSYGNMTNSSTPVTVKVGNESEGGTVSESRTYNSNNGLTSLTNTDGYGQSTNQTYTLDSRGNRLKVEGGTAAVHNFTKRYDYDDRVVTFHKLDTSSYCGVQMCATPGVSNRYNDFRYDPYGQQVVTGTSDIREGGNDEYSIYRITRSTLYIGGEAQYTFGRGKYAFTTEAFVHWSDGKTRGEYDTYSPPDYIVKDQTYSAVDGLTDDIAWDGIQIFSVKTGEVGSLDAPIKPLSSVLDINPLEVGTGVLPRLPDPSQINSNDVTTKDAQISAPVGAAPALDNAKGSPAVKPPKETSVVATLALDVAGGGSTASNLNEAQAKVESQAQKQLDDRMEKEAEEKRRKLLAALNSNSDWGVKGARDVGWFLDYTIRNQPPAEKNFVIDLMAVSIANGSITPQEMSLMVAEAKATEARFGKWDRGRFLEDRQVRGLWSQVFEKQAFSLTMDFVPGINSLKSAYEARYEQDPITGQSASRFFAVLGLIPFGKLGKHVDEVATGGSILGRGLRLAPAEFSAAIGKICKNSFSPNTPVRTISGLLAISTLTIGTPVLAYNEQTRQNGYYPITAVISHGTKDQGVTYLSVRDPEQGGKLEYIQTTPEHPFYIKEWSDAGDRPKPVGHEDLVKNWVGAGHLKIGDKIKQADGTTGVVANVLTLQQTREMFNLTVSEAHTFYVGQDGWLVHNCGPTVTLGARNRVERVQSVITSVDLGTGTGTTDAARRFARSMGLETDDAGHVIANSLGGRGGVRANNIIPLDPTVNRGAFAQFESQVAELARIHGSVKLDIQPLYNYGSSTRPFAIEYKVALPDGSVIRQRFANPK